MKSTAKAVSLIALAVTVIPSLLFFFGAIGLESMKWTALIGTITWFASTPTWMGQSDSE